LANWNTNEATYQWQVSFDGGVTWQNGPGPTATTPQWVFDPTYVDYPNVEGVYSFRLLVTWNGCTGESDVITLTVNAGSNMTSGGEIASDQYLCGSGQPATFTSISLPQGGLTPPNYKYLWEMSTDGVNWTP